MWLASCPPVVDRECEEDRQLYCEGERRHVEQNDRGAGHRRIHHHHACKHHQPLVRFPIAAIGEREGIDHHKGQYVEEREDRGADIVKPFDGRAKTLLHHFVAFTCPNSSKCSTVKSASESNHPIFIRIACCVMKFAHHLDAAFCRHYADHNAFFAISNAPITEFIRTVNLIKQKIIAKLASGDYSITGNEEIDKFYIGDGRTGVHTFETPSRSDYSVDEICAGFDILPSQ